MHFMLLDHWRTSLSVRYWRIDGSLDEDRPCVARDVSFDGMLRALGSTATQADTMELALKMPGIITTQRCHGPRWWLNALAFIQWGVGYVRSLRCPQATNVILLGSLEQIERCDEQGWIGCVEREYVLLASPGAQGPVIRWFRPHRAR